MAKKGKLATKKWVFRAKKRVIGVGKLRVGNQTRKAKWCKTQVICKKNGQKKKRVRLKIMPISMFLGFFSLEGSERRHGFCNIYSKPFKLVSL